MGDLHDEYFDNIYECSRKPQNYLTTHGLDTKCCFSCHVIIPSTLDILRGLISIRFSYTDFKD